LETTWRPLLTKNDYKVLILSGKDEQACQKMISGLADFLEQRKSTQENGERYLESLIYTLGERRTRFPWAAAYPVPVIAGFDPVIQTLRSPKFKPSRSSRQPRIGMVFTGQGAQWYAMGRELITSYPLFKASLEEAEGYLKQLGADWSLMEELSRDVETTRINSVALSTPICVALQISLVTLLQSWGVVPVAVTSHSSGEIAAAFAVGALSYQKAIAFSYYRAVLAAEKSLRGPVNGAMIAVGMFLQPRPLAALSALSLLYIANVVKLQGSGQRIHPPTSDV
jgi:acyl transferase domain-containing protein